MSKKRNLKDIMAAGAISLVIASPLLFATSAGAAPVNAYSTPNGTACARDVVVVMGGDDGQYTVSEGYDCTPSSPPTPPVMTIPPPFTTTTTSPTTIPATTSTTTSTTSTTAAPAAVVTTTATTTTTVPQAVAIMDEVVEEEELSYTGSDSTKFAALGFLLMLAGVNLLLRKKRNI